MSSKVPAPAGSDVIVGADPLFGGAENLAPATPAMGMRPEAGATANDRYLSILLAERQKLAPFVEVLPNCSRLLNQEITRITTLVGSLTYHDADGLDQSLARQTSLGGSPANFLSSPAPRTPSGLADYAQWSPAAADGALQGVVQQTQSLGFMSSPAPANPYAWSIAPGMGIGLVQGPVVKKSRRVDVPIEKHPGYNFVGRLLGPRGNSLKRIEASTGCKVLIRGKGSIKDPAKEEKMRDKAGFEHLKEPLHVQIEAEMPAASIDAALAQAVEIIEGLLKPVDETQDVLKKQQLRELAMLNGTLREEGACFVPARPMSGDGAAGKRAKTRQ